MMAGMKATFRSAFATPWARWTGLLSGALVTAALILLCVQQVAMLAFSAYAMFEGNWAVQSERRTHVVMHARAQVIAVTELARSKGPWSAHSDGRNVQVLAKGDVARAVPRPTGLDLPQHEGEPDSTVILSGGVPEIRIRNLSKLCTTLLGKGNLLHFAQGPMEYAFSHGGHWAPYGEAFGCPEIGSGGDVIRLRPAFPLTVP